MLGDIGSRLRSEREKIGLNQKEFSIACGCSDKTQRRYEAGENKPKDGYLLKASELGVDIGYVLDGVKTDYDTVDTKVSALSKAQRLLNNPELIETIMIVNEVMNKTGMEVTDASKFKRLLSSLAEIEIIENQLSKKELVDKLLLNMARNF
jgi:transcriptional regulator with XRE-family HTH domain